MQVYLPYMDPMGKGAAMCLEVPGIIRDYNP